MAPRRPRTAHTRSKGASTAAGIWDKLIHNGDDASVACDSYNRCEEDIALVKELGVKADLIAKLPHPRMLQVMVPAGEPTDAVPERLLTALEEGDLRSAVRVIKSIA